MTPFTPETTWSAAIQYDWQSRHGTISPRIDVSYQDDTHTAPDNSAAGIIEDYTLVNAGITWLSSGEDWQLALKGRNLTDELYYSMITDSNVLGGGKTYAAPALPRTWEFSVKRMF